MNPVAVPVVMVVAAADNGVIGRDNGLIWRLKSDLRHFRALTLGRPLIMGRRTFASIGKPLPGRQTIVLTRDRAFAADGVLVAHDLPEALALARAFVVRAGADSIVIGGGAQVYREAMALADLLHVTWVHAMPDGDAVFERPSPAEFREVSRREHPAGPDDEHAFSFTQYARR